MGAFVEHDFDKSFLLDEERLRKILQIVNERKLDIEFKVYRGDSYWYVTENIEAGSSSLGIDGTSFKIKLNKRSFGHGDIITYDKYNGLELYITAEDI